MSTLWPWLVVAGAGALHGLNPCSGWIFAAAKGVHSRDRMQAMHALMPIAAGHMASVVLVAAAVALGMEMNHVTVQVTAAALLAALLFFAGYRLSGRRSAQRATRQSDCRIRPGRVPATTAGLALWSFMMATLHGAGLMLVPALMPLCLSNSPAREITASGSLLPALAAVGVHMAAMLAMTAVMAAVACRSAGPGARLLQGFRRRPDSGSA